MRLRHAAILTLITLVVACASVPISAQRPIAATTLTTTSTSADSIHVGCAVGAAGSTCTGGIKAGTATIATATITTLAALLNESAFGAHMISSAGTGQNSLTIRNTTAGTGNFSAVFAGNDASATNAYIESFSSTFTPTTTKLADGALFAAERAGGLSIAALDAAGTIRFHTGGATQRWGINAAGDFTVGASANIADSTGTPSVGTCGTSPSISGTDYALKIITGSTATTACTATFGHTWSQIPICVAASGSGNAVTTIVPSVSTVVFQYSSASGQTIYALCRGF